MRSRWVCALVAAFALAAPSTVSADVPSIIVDSDIALWWDDVSAFAIANAAADKGDVRFGELPQDADADADDHYALR